MGAAPRRAALTFYYPDAAESEGQAELAARAEVRTGLTAFERLLMYGAVLSFAYEIPLFNLTGYQRSNPHLFDVAVIALAGYWFLRRWPITLENPLFKPWLVIMAGFGLSMLAAGVWVPLSTYSYCVFFFAKYMEGLVFLLIVLNAPLDERDKRGMLWAGLLGGAWVSAIGLLQFFGIVSPQRYLPGGFEIPHHLGAINSTLGHSYFHVGQFGTLSAMIGIALFRASRGLPRMLAGLLVPFAAIPSVIGGSRAGFLGLVIAGALLVLQKEYRKHLGTFIVAALFVTVTMYFFEASRTKERIEIEGGQNSIQARLTQGPRTLARVLENHGPALFLVGGGLYVVPVDGYRWRIGYGNHNIHLFTLEQGGMLAFVGGIWLWVRMGRSLYRRRRDPATSDLDRSYASSMFAYAVALVVAGIGGQIFYLGFGTEHLTFYQLLLLGLAMKATSPGKGSRRERWEEDSPPPGFLPPR